MGGKLIVTNFSRLTEKYGVRGRAKVRAALAELVASDRRRQLHTTIIGLDVASDMRPLRAPLVRDARDPKENKRAIDGVIRALSPDYVVIVGSVDVIPHQILDNPLARDGDPHVASDLPYACTAPFGRKIKAFTGPTRVVGRLPNVTGDRDPNYLIGLVHHARDHRSLSSDAYVRYFGLSAEKWSASSRLNVDTVFGHTKHLALSPRSGPRFSRTRLKRLTHFINCHGATIDPTFYGEGRASKPVAHHTSWLRGKISSGTVAAVECCYGAELYDPERFGVEMPIANAYLGDGAYGFIGSTSLAYGPAVGNDQADVICQHFLLQVLSGASLGRAFLEARQAFVSLAAQLDPVNLKTLAQFILLGDPSIHPVCADSPDKAPLALGRRLARGERRERLEKTGEFLADTKEQTASRGRELPPRLARKVTSIARDAKLDAPTMLGFGLVGGRPGKSGETTRPSSYVVIEGARGRGARAHRVCIVAKEVDGHIVAYREYDQR